MADPREGKVLQGRYRILSLLAEGGMGVVYKGERVGIGRPVVVKFLHAVLVGQAGHRRSLRARGARHRAAEPPQLRRAGRLRHRRRRALPRDGVRRGQDARRPPRSRPGAARARGRDRAADPGRPRARARARHPAPRSEAGERDDRRVRRLPGRLRQDPRLRAGQAGVAGRGQARRHRRGHRHRHAGLHVARAGGGRAERSAQRHLLHGRAALSPRHRHQGLRRRRRALGACAATARRRRRRRARSSRRPGSPKQLEEVLYRAMQRDPGKRYQHAREMAAALRDTPELHRARRRDNKPPPLPRVRPPPPSGDDATRAEAPASRGRTRRGSRAPAAWAFVGVIAGSVAAVAAVAYSPLGEYVHPRDTTRAKPRIVAAPEQARDRARARHAHAAVGGGGQAGRHDRAGAGGAAGRRNGAGGSGGRAGGGDARAGQRHGDRGQRRRRRRRDTGQSGRWFERERSRAGARVGRGAEPSGAIGAQHQRRAGAACERATPTARSPACIACAMPSRRRRRRRRARSPR